MIGFFYPALVLYYMDNVIIQFYEDHVFDFIDHHKWQHNDPSNYYIDINGKIVASLTIIKRIPEASDCPNINKEIDHIWLCGVHKDYRGKGLFGGLIKHFKEACTDTISVATYPERWTDMYAWILRKGGRLIHTCKDGKCIFTILRKNL